MSHDNDQTISLYQSNALIVGTTIGVGVLTFQRGVAEDVGPNGIWTILLGGGGVLLQLWIVTRLLQQFPGRNLVHAASGLLGSKHSPWVGKVLSIPILVPVALFWLGATAVVTRTFGEVVVSGVLPRTPMIVIMVTLIGGAAFVAGQHPGIIARFNEFLLPVLFMPIPFLVVAWVQKGEWEHFFPLFRLDWAQLGKGIVNSAFAYSGFSVIFMYMAHYQQPKRAMRAHLLALVTVIAGYWTTMAASLAVFGPEELKFLLWPTLDLVKQAEVPGQILSRMESAILAIWMVAVFTTLVNLFGALVELGITVFRLKNRRRVWLAWGMAPLLLLLANRPPDLQELLQWNNRVGLFEPIAAPAIALLLLLIVWIRRKKERKSHVPTSS